MCRAKPRWPRRRRVPGLARALELYRLDLRTEATREWVFTIRGMDDAQLLAAAELARRAGIFDRAINTADRTAHQHNYKVRFLAPFSDVFSEQARSSGLEEAWVLGLVRQESRFIVERQVLGRRARADAADARDRALGRQAQRRARLQPGAASPRCRSTSRSAPAT